LLTNRATHLSKRNGVADPLKHASLSVCFHAEIGFSALKGAGEPQKNGVALELCFLEM